MFVRTHSLVAILIVKMIMAVLTQMTIMMKVEGYKFFILFATNYSSWRFTIHGATQRDATDVPGLGDIVSGSTSVHKCEYTCCEEEDYDSGNRLISADMAIFSSTKIMKPCRHSCCPTSRQGLTDRLQ